jgi:hypothetical protein
MPLPRKSSPLRTAYYLIFSLLITANVVFIASRFRTGTALDHGGIRVLERKDHQDETRGAKEGHTTYPRSIQKSSDPGQRSQLTLGLVNAVLRSSTC